MISFFLFSLCLFPTFSLFVALALFLSFPILFFCLFVFHGRLHEQAEVFMYFITRRKQREQKCPLAPFLFLRSSCLPSCKFFTFTTQYKLSSPEREM